MNAEIFIIHRNDVHYIFLRFASRQSPVNFGNETRKLFLQHSNIAS